MKNCEFYGLFDYTASDGDVYEYTSAEWSQYIKGITGNGISKNALNEFAPTANGLVITIASGEAYIEGRYAYNTTATQFSLTPTSTGQNRYDRIVLELDEENRVIGLNVVAGTASTSTPTKPTLNANQLPICSVLVSNGSTTTLTDERKFTYSATAIQSQLNNYLLLSGGTLSGSLCATYFQVNGTNDYPTYYFKANSQSSAGAMIQTGSTNSLGFFLYNKEFDGKSTRYYEGYSFSEPASGLTSNKSYTIYSTKNIVYSSTQPTAEVGKIWLKPMA